MADQPKLAWKTVNTAKLPQSSLKKYNAYQSAIEAATKLRKDMEADIAAHLARGKKIPAGMEPKFSYKWGKMALAFGEPSVSASGSELFEV